MKKFLNLLKRIGKRVRERIADLFKPPSQEQIFRIFSTMEIYDNGPPTEEEVKRLMEYVDSLMGPKEN